MNETIFENIDPVVLEKVQSLRLIDDELMTLIFSGDKKATEFIHLMSKMRMANICLLMMVVI